MGMGVSGFLQALMFGIKTRIMESIIRSGGGKARVESITQRGGWSSMKRSKARSERLLKVAAGRTIDEQIECVRKHENHGLASVLRTGVLENLGIADPKPTAENMIIFGCYTPFTYGNMLRDYIKILDLIGLDYTYLEDEMCCGAPMILPTSGAEREKAKKAGREFMQMNNDMAQQKGATTIAYCCGGCTRMAKGLLPEEAGRHVHLLDLIAEKLEKKALRISPTVVGYFEGCQARYSAVFPGVNFDWAGCRGLLDGIEGLTVLDLPNNICCTKQPERIMEAAEKQNLDTIVSPCNGCYNRLGIAADGGMQVKHLSEILLQSLRGD